MRTQRNTTRVTTLLRIVALMTSQPFGRAEAAQPSPPATTLHQKRAQTIDVVLSDHSRLIGRVIDGQGQPVTGVKVSLVNTDGTVLHATAAQQGRFAFDGIRGGEYLLNVNGTA